MLTIEVKGQSKTGPRTIRKIRIVRGCVYPLKFHLPLIFYIFPHDKNVKIIDIHWKLWYYDSTLRKYIYTEKEYQITRTVIPMGGRTVFFCHHLTMK
jgi:hypothetical protein